MDITAFLNSEKLVDFISRIERFFYSGLSKVDMFTVSLICFMAIAVFTGFILFGETENVLNCFTECELFSFFTLLVVELFGYFKFIDNKTLLFLFSIAQICEFVAITVLYAVILLVKRTNTESVLPFQTEAASVDNDENAMSLDVNRVKRFSLASYDDFKIERIYLQKKERQTFASPVNYGYVLSQLQELKKTSLDFKERQFVEEAVIKIYNYKFEKPADYFSEFSQIASETVCLMAKYLK